MGVHWMMLISPVVHHAGIVRMGKGIINPWRQILDHELFMFDDGRAKMVVEDREYTFDEPWFIIIPPATRHISYCLSHDVVIYYSHFNWVHGDHPSTPSMVYTRERGITHQAMPAPAYVPKELRYGPLRSRLPLELHRRVVDAFAPRHTRGELAARGLYLQELVELLGPDEPSRHLAPGPDSHAELARQVLTEYAHVPFAEAPPLKEALTRAGASYFHLERLFRRRYNVSPHRYVSLIRIERARELLLRPDATVSSCAAAMGYPDVGYFIRFFRKHMGVSPLVFRRREGA